MGALCGFLGAPNPETVESMALRLRHRGRVSVERAETSTGTVAFSGHENGSVARAGEYILAVVGEVFGAKGSAGRAERLLQAFLRGGMDEAAGVPGAFAFALLRTTPASPELTLYREPSGTRVLYWGRYDGRVFFATEPKALLAVPGFPRRLRMDGLLQYLSYSFQPGAGTMLEDVHEVPVGAAVSLGLEGFRRTTDHPTPFEHVPREDADDTTWVTRTRDCVREAIACRRPSAGERVGVFLSGGLDSSIVAAELQRQRTDRVKTFSIHFGRDYPNELAFAKAVADRIGSEHEEVEIRPKDFLPRLRQIIEQLDDPVGDPITVPNFELARHASQRVGVIFNGEGGDPLFGGPKNLSMMLQHWYGLDHSPRARSRAYLATYRRAYEERHRLLTPTALAQVNEAEALEAPLERIFDAPRPESFLNKLMAVNIRLKGASLIQPKVDRMVGAHGLRVRAPLFDAELMRLSFAMPPTMKLRSGVEKWALKQAFADLLPTEVVTRPKSGMRVPVHYWFKGEMKKYARKILSPREIRRVGIFDERRVEQLLRYDTEEGPGRYGIRLWMLLTFELWRRIVVERESV